MDMSPSRWGRQGRHDIAPLECTVTHIGEESLPKQDRDHKLAFRICCGRKELKFVRAWNVCDAKALTILARAGLTTFSGALSQVR